MGLLRISCGGRWSASAEDSVAATAKAIAAAVARELVETFAYAILYMLIFVALVILLRLAALAINLVLRLPVLSSVNTFGGALLGLLEGMMVVWLLIWLAAPLRHRPSRGEHLSASLFHDGRTNGPAVIPIIISLWSAARSVGYGGNYAANTLFQM